MVEGIHGAFSLATAQTFWLGVFGAVVSLVAAVAIKEIPLRTSNERRSTAGWRRGRCPAGGAPAPARSPTASLAARVSRPSTDRPLEARIRPGRPRRPGRSMSRATIGRVTAILPFPPTLLALGAGDAPFRADDPRGGPAAGRDAARARSATSTSCSRTRTAGIVAVDDRCPHMSAPLSIGELDGCVVACPLHSRPVRPRERRPRADADDRRPVARRPLRARLVAARPRARSPTRPARRPRPAA